jgi:hypothetical protein
MPHTGDRRVRLDHTLGEDYIKRRPRRAPPAVGRPRQDSNLRHRLRRPVLYPLSYGGGRPLVPVAVGRPTSRERS